MIPIYYIIGLIRVYVVISATHVVCDLLGNWAIVITMLIVLVGILRVLNYLIDVVISFACLRSMLLTELRSSVVIVIALIGVHLLTLVRWIVAYTIGTRRLLIQDDALLYRRLVRSSCVTALVLL